MKVLSSVVFLAMALLAGQIQAHDYSCYDPSVYNYGGDIDFRPEATTEALNLIGQLSRLPENGKLRQVYSQMSSICRNLEVSSRYIVRDNLASDLGEPRVLEVEILCMDDKSTEDAEETSYFFRFQLNNPNASCSEMTAG